MIIDGATIGLGKRLDWPDDFFFTLWRIKLTRGTNLTISPIITSSFPNGTSNLLTLTTKLTRFSTSPNLIYPRNGSTFTLSLQLTPPYSLISGTNMVGCHRTGEIQMD